ncbi:Hypothetical protein MAU_1710 [Metamycoplasma auris 15026]|uniref:Uncharacterized protein n=1 Tax=Metamycoplasma auris 15026 TaxID=1188233 RepID=N9TSS3_9BACT|nr:hypothetical protein [Metamycoplasma auris]ENY69130.1 Hypothetical protein MAU_1710 [Metamycoplasma auris 15026]
MMKEKYLKTFEEIKSTFKNNEDKALYDELIKEILLNCSKLNKDIKSKVITKLVSENSFDTLVSIYKFTSDLVDCSVEEHPLSNIFFKDKDIHSFHDLWEEMDSDLRTNGIDANIYLLKDLLEVQDTRLYIKLDECSRAIQIKNIEKDFQTWIVSKSIEQLLVLYPFQLKDYLEEKKLELVLKKKYEKNNNITSNKKQIKKGINKEINEK